MKIYNTKTQKIHIYKDIYSPADTLYVLEFTIDIYSSKFNFKEYQEFRKPILKHLGFSQKTKIIPYSQII